MGRYPRHEERGLKKGPWTPEEDQKLVLHIEQHGHGSWRALPKHAGLNRCGKSCRLRWTNYLRPDIKRGKFSEEEEQTILHLHSVLGNKWSSIASRLPGRTDNEIKNFWNTHLKKKLIQMGFDPMTHQPRQDHFYSSLPHLIALANLKALIDYHQLSQNLMPSSHYGQTFSSVTDLLQTDSNNAYHIQQMVNDLLISSGSGDASEPIEAQSYNEQPILTSSVDFYYSQPLCHQMPPITSLHNDDNRETHYSSCLIDSYGGGGEEGDHVVARSVRKISVEEPCLLNFNNENCSQGFWPELISCESSSVNPLS